MKWAGRLVLVLGLPACLLLAVIFPRGRAMAAWLHCWRHAGGEPWK